MRDPAFCFLFVVPIGWRLQIAAQVRDDLFGSTFGEVDLRENQAGIREGLFALLKKLESFRSDTALANKGASQEIPRCHWLRIKTQSLAGLGFRFLIAIQ